MGTRPDPRFFDTLAPLSVASLAALGGGQVLRDYGNAIARVSPLTSADVDSVAFVGDRRFFDALKATDAGCVFVPSEVSDRVPDACAVIVSPTPQAAWAAAAAALHRPRFFEASDRADVCEDDTVVLEPGAVIGRGAQIGRGTRIGANTMIGPGVQIGRDVVVGPNVTIGFALIGDRVKIYAGARIGEAGFGAAPSATGPVDVPQLGRVILQDRVTIGANTCVDRGAFDDTVIGENTKIDNLVMIGHNCVIGRNCLIAGHAGISGSVTVGDGVIFGGKAGVGDHIEIGSGARIAAGAGVLADVPAGEIWSGYPAKPLRQFLREALWLSKQVGRKGARTDG